MQVSAAIRVALLAIGSRAHRAQAQVRPIVHVIPIERMIDMGLAAFVQRVLDQAKRDRAAAVILDKATAHTAIAFESGVRQRLNPPGKRAPVGADA